MRRIVIADLPFSNNLRMVKIVREGIPARALIDLADTLNVGLYEVADLVLIPRRTLDRRTARNALLNLAETERAVRLGRVYAKAKNVFEEGGEAARWLAEPLDSLRGETPLQMCRNELGAREVEQILGRIEHGVFA